MTDASQDTELLDALWEAAKICAINDSRSDAVGLRDNVATALRDLIGEGPDLRVYVTKTNASGYRNQVWQGQGKSQPNDVIVLVDTSENREGVESEARSRLSPLSKSGFDAVVICSHRDDDETDWQISAVVEYDHSSVGEKLKARLGSDIQIETIADPSSAAPKIGASQAGEQAYLSLPNSIIQHLIEAKNVVLSGPPGTGKTHLALEIIEQFGGHQEGETVRLEDVLQGRRPEDVPIDEVQAPSLVWDLVQLHPSYGYEEFVRGLRTSSEHKGFTLISVDGALTTMARFAARRGDKPTLLIIDEINRANVAAVFGETIFAMDPGQRGRSVRLQYDGSHGAPDNLVIPPNLYLLATMNTADRSIAMVDYAFRRRFRFVHVAPSIEQILNYYVSDKVRGQVAGQLLEAINARIQDREIAVGHSYFLVDPTLPRLDWGKALAERIYFEVRPLLQEYIQEGRMSEAEGDGIDVDAVEPVTDTLDDIYAKIRLALEAGAPNDEG